MRLSFLLNAQLLMHAPSLLFSSFIYLHNTHLQLCGIVHMLFYIFCGSPPTSAVNTVLIFFHFLSSHFSAVFLEHSSILMQSSVWRESLCIIIRYLSLRQIRFFFWLKSWVKNIVNIYNSIGIFNFFFYQVKYIIKFH